MNSSNKIIDINHARAKGARKRKNPFERALVEEGEFITIKPFKKAEVNKEEGNASTNNNIHIPNR